MTCVYQDTFMANTGHLVSVLREIFDPNIIF